MIFSETLKHAFLVLGLSLSLLLGGCTRISEVITKPKDLFVVPDAGVLQIEALDSNGSVTSVLPCDANSIKISFQVENEKKERRPAFDKLAHNISKTISFTEGTFLNPKQVSLDIQTQIDQVKGEFLITFDRSKLGEMEGVLTARVFFGSKTAIASTFKDVVLNRIGCGTGFADEEESLLKQIILN